MKSYIGENREEIQCKFSVTLGSPGLGKEVFEGRR
jgi:hypothetical protein